MCSSFGHCSTCQAWPTEMVSNGDQGGPSKCPTIAKRLMDEDLGVVLGARVAALAQHVSQARDRARGIVRALAEGLVIVESAAAEIALCPWAQGRVSCAVVPPDTPELRGFRRLPVDAWVRAVRDAVAGPDALFASLVAGLGTRPVVFPLFACADAYAFDWKGQFVAVVVAEADGRAEPLLLAVPRSVPREATEPVRSLVRRVRHCVKWSSLRAPAHPELRLVVHRLGESVWIPAWRSSSLQRSLMTLLKRTDTTPAGGWPAPAAPPPPRAVREPSHRDDAPIRHLRALFPLDEDLAGLGSALRKGKEARAREQCAALRLVFPAAAATGARGVVESAEAADAAVEMAAWADATMARLAADPQARVQLPACAALALAPGVATGPALPPPSSFLAASLGRLVAARRPELSALAGDGLGGAAPGGVSAAAPPPAAEARALLSVRGAHDREVVEAAWNAPLPTRNVGDVPGAVLPCLVLDDLGAVRPHVLAHTELVPRELVVPLAPAKSVAGMCLDVDGCAINLRCCPANLLQLVDAAVQEIEHTDRDSDDDDDIDAVPLAAAAAAAPDGELAAMLRQSVVAAAAAAAGRRTPRFGGASTVPVCIPAAAILRGNDAGRPTDLAFAAAATLLTPPPVCSDARAVVAVVTRTALRLGVAAVLRGQLVSVPASGWLPPTKAKPTVNPQFVTRAAARAALGLPAPTGSATEPVRVVVVGVAAADVARATRDVVGAFVLGEPTGSVGQARAAGLPTRGPHDVVVLSGGGLVAFAILALLLVRHARGASSRPFAFIKL